MEIYLRESTAISRMYWSDPVLEQKIPVQYTNLGSKHNNNEAMYGNLQD